MGVLEKHMVSLAERDLDLIRLLWKLRFLSTKQIERLFFPGSPGGRVHKLTRLRQRKFLDLAQQRDRHIQQETIWFLAPLGRRVAAELEGGQPGRGGTLGLLFWRHYLLVSEFYVVLFEAQRAGLISGLDWTAPPETRSTFRGFAGRVGTNVVEPDARVVVFGPTSSFSFLLEADRGTMAAGAMKLKIRRLAQWYSEAPREEDLLFLVPDDRRQAEIQGWLAAAGLPGTVLKLEEAVEFVLGRLAVF